LSGRTLEGNRILRLTPLVAVLARLLGIGAAITRPVHGGSFCNHRDANRRRHRRRRFVPAARGNHRGENGSRRGRVRGGCGTMRSSSAGTAVARDRLADVPGAREDGGMLGDFDIPGNLTINAPARIRPSSMATGSVTSSICSWARMRPFLGRRFATRIRTARMKSAASE
jgi:hypothetical protein